jgi:predicted transcriptional regulator
MAKHLAIFTPTALKQILSGTKTIEGRFSKNRIAPFCQVSVGDLVYIKLAGEEIVGRFIVKKVINFENLDQSDWSVIAQHYAAQLSLAGEQDIQQFRLDHKDAKYATLIFIDQVEQFITSPIRIPKSDRRGWVVLI